VNEAIREPRDAQYTYDAFPYRLDGVVNNVDGKDDAADYTLVNMAVQGRCRLDHREAYRADEAAARMSATVYVGLFATRTMLSKKWTHRLERFSSNMIARGRIDLGSDDGYDKDGNETKRVLLFGWTVGRIVDAAQSKDMLAVNVDVRPLRPILQADAEPYQPKDPAHHHRAYVLRWRLAEKQVVVPAVFGDAVGDRSVLQQLLASGHDGEQQAKDAEEAELAAQRVKELAQQKAAEAAASADALAALAAAATSGGGTV